MDSASHRLRPVDKCLGIYPPLLPLSTIPQAYIVAQGHQDADSPWITLTRFPPPARCVPRLLTTTSTLILKFKKEKKIL